MSKISDPAGLIPVRRQMQRVIGIKRVSPNSITRMPARHARVDRTAYQSGGGTPSSPARSAR